MGIERNYDPAFVARLAAAEKQVQQSYRPIIGVHKWFARRPGALFRSLILAELVEAKVSDSYFTGHDLSGTVVLDPFMGGGTTLFEANRLGLSTVGYDTNPLSRWIVERELEPIDVNAFEEAGEAVCLAAEAQLGGLYLTECEECGRDVPVKSFLWVKTHVCSNGHETLLFNGPLVAGRRMKRHTHDVLICGRCHEVHQALPDEPSQACPSCGAAYSETSVRANDACATCREPFIVPEGDMVEPYPHTLFALEYFCRSCRSRPNRRGRFFKAPDAGDHRRYADAVARCAELRSPRWPTWPIPAGDETKRLHRWGYHRFCDLHNPRQRLGLHVLAEEILNQPRDLQPALATVYSDFLRYQNMICRYDTAALKVLDVFSVHGFPVNRVQCENALIGVAGVGSGGYRHFLKKYATAKRYCEEPFETVRKDGRKRRVSVDGERIAAQFTSDPAALEVPRTTLLETGSIARRPPPDGSVDMVLTDPPYFANVQYSELMDLCYAWLRQIVDAPYFATESSRSDDEVTGNDHGGRDIFYFAQGLSEVYRAASRSLKAGGPFVFTYHHNDPLSYAALVVASLDAGLVPQATLVCPSEMRGSVHISKSASSRVDSVFVLRKPPAPAGELEIDIPQCVANAARQLVEADLEVSAGDERCMRFGFIAEQAMRWLSPTWDREAPIDQKVATAVDAIKRSVDAHSTSGIEHVLGAGVRSSAAASA